MNRRHYCTYFDERYFSRGMAMLESLRRFEKEAPLTVLCLSPECAGMVRRQAVPGLVILALEDLEAAWPALATARADRSLVEFFFTCTPFLVQQVMRSVEPGALVTYLDADLFFFSSPEPLFIELAERSVAIIPHRFPPDLSGNVIYGEFNVGWLTFRQDESGRDCLGWWADRCAEWCFDRVEPGRFADQKYLDEFLVRCSGVQVISHPGANLAPWNIRSHRIDEKDKGVEVDGQPLIFFHFHGFQFPRPWLVTLPFPLYRAPWSRVLRKAVAGPWLRAVNHWSQPLPSPGANTPRAGHTAPALPDSWTELTRQVWTSQYHVTGWRAVVVKALKNLGIGRPPAPPPRPKPKKKPSKSQSKPKPPPPSPAVPEPPPDRLYFHGDYSTWELASAESGGYAEAHILEATRQAMHRIASGEAVYERDSVIMDVPEYPFSTIAGLLLAAARRPGKLNVLDFGGALASTYFACRPWLDALPELHWAVVEQAHYVACGQAEFSNERVSFYHTLAEAAAAHPPDVVLLSGSLHFLPQAEDIIAELCRMSVPYVLLERSPFWEGERHRMVIQHVPADIYPADYPCWLFSEPLLMEQFRPAFRMLASYPALDVIPLEGGKSYFKGILLARNQPVPSPPREHSLTPD